MGTYFNPNNESFQCDKRSEKTINTYITRNFDGLKDNILDMLSGNKFGVDVGTVQNDLSILKSKDEVLTALIHLGYLGYDADRKSAYIPNYEVASAYDLGINYDPDSKSHSCEIEEWAGTGE